MPVSRPTRRPLPDFVKSDLPVTPYPARELWRLHETGLAAIYFSLNPEHRFSHADCPCPVLYLGEQPTTCIWERFGDGILNPGSRVSLKLWTTRTLSRVKIPDLKLCDLTDATTAGRAKVDLSALTNAELSVPQEWGLQIQQHPAGFDGLRYLSRFDGQPCVALFGRPGITKRMTEKFVANLVDSPEGDALLNAQRIALV